MAQGDQAQVQEQQDKVNLMVDFNSVSSNDESYEQQQPPMLNLASLPRFDVIDNILDHDGDYENEEGCLTPATNKTCGSDIKRSRRSD